MCVAAVDHRGDLAEIDAAPAQGKHVGDRARGINQRVGIAAGAAVIRALNKTHKLRVIEVHKDPSKP